MVEESEKSAAAAAANEELEKLSLMDKNHHGDESETEEGEIIAGDSEAMAPPPPRHPLENSWTFWFDNPSSKAKGGRGEAQFALFTPSPPSKISGGQRYAFFDLACSVYNNIHHPSKLAVGADFYCFKQKIEPKWEDPICANGGKWTVTFSRGKSDTAWLYTLLAMIGEQFDYGDEICGAVVNVRTRQEKISIWTKNAANEAAQLSIGKQWKELLDYNDSIGYIIHDDAKKYDRLAKNHYTV